MTILKVRGKSDTIEANKYVGVYLPQRISCYLTLYSFAKGIPKSSIVQEIMNNWVEELPYEDQENGLIKQIYTKTLLIWKKKKARHPELLLTAFKEQLIYELEFKGISVDIIKKILIGFNDGTK